MSNKNAQNIYWYELLVSNCRKSIAQADQGRYFEFVEAYLEHNEYKKNDYNELELNKNRCLLLQSKFSQIKRDQSSNAISHENYYYEISKLNNALIEYLRDLKPDASSTVITEIDYESIPDYEWNYEENIIAILHFINTDIKECFDKFVNSKRNSKEIRTERYVWDYPENAEPRERKIPEGEEPEEDELVETREMLWSDAIRLEKRGSDNFIEAEAFVEKFDKTHKISIHVNGKGDKKRTLMTEMLQSFRQSDTSPMVTFICNCEICRNLGELHSQVFHEGELKAFQRRYKRRIQCHKSGNHLRLDEISNFEQPMARIVLLYEEENDRKFLEELKKRFRRGWDLSIEVWDKSQILLGTYEPDELIFEKIRKAHIVITLLSVDFINDATAMRCATLAIERFKKGEIWAGAIEVRSCAWAESFPFSTVQIPALNDTPVSSNLNPDETWRKISDKIHKDIEDWLEKLALRNTNVP